MTGNEKRELEKALRQDGFGQGTAKRIVAVVGRHLAGREEEAAKRGRQKREERPDQVNRSPVRA